MRRTTGKELGPQIWLDRHNHESESPRTRRPHPAEFKSPFTSAMTLPCKPGGGLWTSSHLLGEDEPYLSDWVRYSTEDGFGPGEFRAWRLVPRDDVKLLEVDTFADLASLHNFYGEVHYLTPQYEQYVLNFERMAKAGYDGFHLTYQGQIATRLSQPFNLYGWDCESTLWFTWPFNRADITDLGIIRVKYDWEAASEEVAEMSEGS